MRRAIALASLALTACFGILDEYTCDDDEQCNGRPGGRCEATGYCSYVDDACESGRRYARWAPPMYSGQCVELEGATTTSTTSATTTTDATSSSSGGDGCPQPACVDLDGAGYGVGAACAGPDCDDANETRFDGCYYVSPDGSDGNPGDNPAAPWGTLAHAVGALQPGDSLVLLPGSYETESTGMLDVRCGDGGNAVTANETAPISIRSGVDPSEERQAILASDGTTNAIRIDGCAHWRLFGLAARGADLAGGVAEVVLFSGVSNLTARRLLVADANAWVASSLLLVTGTSADVLVEESEGYSFHRWGVRTTSDSANVTFRRLYVNARSRDDLADAVPEDNDPNTPLESQVTKSGDWGIIARGTKTRVENCIVQGDVGYALGVWDDATVAGTIAIGPGFFAWSDGGFFTLRDIVSIGATTQGISLRSVDDVLVDGATVINTGVMSDIGGAGIVGDEPMSDPCVDHGGCKFTVRDALVLNSGRYGIIGTGANDWRVEASNVYGSGVKDYSVDEPIDDNEGFIRGSQSQPVEGADDCYLVSPSGIGAEVLYRWKDGELTDDPLWDPQTRVFPCGAEVEGINTQEGSCRDVHEAVNFNNGCLLPPATCPS